MSVFALPCLVSKDLAPIKKSFCLFLWCLGLFSSLQAQISLQIQDQKGLPVVGVLIYNQGKTKAYSSNAQGKVKQAYFQQGDTIFFQHPNYQPSTISYSQLLLQDHQVTLLEKNTNLDEIVVSASKWEQNAQEVPVKITRIESEEIAFQNPQTAADLLGISKEVFIQKSQLGGGSPMLRGFSANSVLLVVDGVRMNNAIFRGGNLQNVISLDANSIEEAEVLFGPGSVIYGSDALGGVMDFHTLRPKLATGEQAEFSGNASTRFSSANREKMAHLDWTLAGQKWAWLSSVSFSDYDDLRMGSQGREEYTRPEYVDRIHGQDTVLLNADKNRQIPTGYHQLNVLQKIRFQPRDDLNLEYAFHYSRTSDVPRYDRLIERREGQLRFAEWYYGPQKWMMHRLHAQYIHPTSFFDQAQFTLAYQSYEESRQDRRFKEDDLRSRTEQVDIFTANLDFDRDIGQHGALFYGVEAVYNQVGSSAFVRNISNGQQERTSTRYPDGSEYASWAVYSSYKYNWKEQFTFTAGLRFNQVLIRADVSENEAFFDFPFEQIDLSNAALNGSLGMVYRPRTDWQINLNLSTGFRAPNIDDVAKVFDSEPGSVVVPNPNLQPEYAYNLDVALIKRWQQGHEIQLNTFYTQVDDLMVRRDFRFNGQDSILYDGQLSKTEAIVNAASARIYGFSTSLRAYLLPNLYLQTHLTYTQGETDEGEAVRHVAPLFGSTRLVWTPLRWRLEFSGDYSGEIPYDRLAPSERDKPQIYATDANGNPFSPAWYTLHLKAAFQITSFLEINTGVENILDKRYRPYSSGIVAPGQNWMIALRGQW